MDRDARQFSSLVQAKQDVEIVEALRIIEPRAERVEILSEYGVPTIFVDLGLPSLIPLAACGEGFVRFFSIVVEVTACRGGVLLIDELDNGLHHSVMGRLWKLLYSMCVERDVQLVATTHNDDVLTSAIDELEREGALEELAAYRIDRRGDRHEAVRYDADMLRAVRLQNLEIRG